MLWGQNKQKIDSQLAQLLQILPCAPGTPVQTGTPALFKFDSGQDLLISGDGRATIRALFVIAWGRYPSQRGNLKKIFIGGLEYKCSNEKVVKVIVDPVQSEKERAKILAARRDSIATMQKLKAENDKLEERLKPFTAIQKAVPSAEKVDAIMDGIERDYEENSPGILDSIESGWRGVKKWFWSLFFSVFFPVWLVMFLIHRLFDAEIQKNEHGAKIVDMFSWISRIAAVFMVIIYSVTAAFVVTEAYYFLYGKGWRWLIGPPVLILIFLLWKIGDATVADFRVAYDKVHQYLLNQKNK